jgi:hypothetical protein
MNVIGESPVHHKDITEARKHRGKPKPRVIAVANRKTQLAGRAFWTAHCNAGVARYFFSANAIPR